MQVRALSVPTDVLEVVQRVGRLYGHPSVERILEVGAEEPFEHVHATVELSGITRASAEKIASLPGFILVSSKNVTSQIVMPEASEDVTHLLSSAAEDIGFIYEELIDAAFHALDEPNAVVRQARAREIAGLILPQGASCEAVVTASFAAWRRFVRDYGQGYAPAELGQVATLMGTVNALFEVERL